MIIAFISGVAVGVIAGVAISALLRVAAEADRHAAIITALHDERQRAEPPPPHSNPPS